MAERETEAVGPANSAVAEAAEMEPAPESAVRARKAPATTAASGETEGSPKAAELEKTAEAATVEVSAGPEEVGTAAAEGGSEAIFPADSTDSAAGKTPF